jgi:sugar phosphate isomerase/epimerase
MVSNTDGALRLIEAVGRTNLGVILDTGHQHAQKENLSLAVKKMKNRVFFVHLSDNDGRDNLHLALGDGSIDWKAFFAALREVGYQGSLGIDVGGVPDVDAAFLRSKQRILEMRHFSQ